MAPVRLTVEGDNGAARNLYSDLGFISEGNESDSVQQVTVEVLAGRASGPGPSTALAVPTRSPPPPGARG
jgi:hypothetical protein